MAFRTGPDLSQRFCTDLFSVSATGAVVSSPCLLYSVIINASALGSQVVGVLTDALASGSNTPFLVMTMNASSTGGGDLVKQVVFTPPVVLTAGLFASGSNLTAKERITVQAYVIS